MRHAALALILAACGEEPAAASDAETGSTSDAPGTSTSSSGGGDTTGSAASSSSGEDASSSGSGTGVPCEDSLPADAEAPELLSQTGLYEDIEAKTLAAYVQPFSPRYELWSDAAQKARWVYLPECGVVDTSDMDDWSFPVGARLWKEFAIDGVRIETRLIERVGEGPYDFVFAAYVWNEDETEATIAPEGVVNVAGTTHDVPDEPACRECHGTDTEGGGRPSRVLGFSALQLPATTLDELSAAGMLTDAPDGDYEVPGGGAEQAALGYLHANCGHCHNATADAAEPIDLDLWVSVDDVDVEDTGAYRTAVGVANTLFNDQHVTARIEPGFPEQSSVAFRMRERGNAAQMPPLGTEAVDDTGSTSSRSGSRGSREAGVRGAARGSGMRGRWCRPGRHRWHDQRRVHDKLNGRPVDIEHRRSRRLHLGGRHVHHGGSVDDDRRGTAPELPGRRHRRRPGRRARARRLGSARRPQRRTVADDRCRRDVLDRAAQPGLRQAGRRRGQAGYRTSAVEFSLSLPDEPVMITIREILGEDNLAYEFLEPGTGVDDPNTGQCGHCHESFAQQFQTSKHAEATRNPLLQSLYAGVDASLDEPGCAAAGGTWLSGLDPGTADAVDKCYVGGGVLPDLNPGCGGAAQPACDDPAIAPVDAPTALGAAPTATPRGSTASRGDATFTRPPASPSTTACTATSATRSGTSTSSSRPGSARASCCIAPASRRSWRPHSGCPSRTGRWSTSRTR